MNFKKLTAIKGVKVELIITGSYDAEGNIHEALDDGERWPNNVFVNSLIGDDESIEEVLNEVHKCIPGRLDNK